MPSYFDYNSTATILPSILPAVTPYLREQFGNPSSNNCLGKKAAEAVRQARLEVADFIGAEEAEIVFTSGGTESIFAAIVGAYRARPERRHVVLSAVEHSATFEAAKFLQDLAGVEISVVGVDSNGQLSLAELEQAIRADTSVVSCMLANNETGILFPVAEISKLAHAQGALCHTDAVQAAGKISIDVDALGVDLLSLSGHKFGGLKGSGALYIRKGSSWAPVMVGGGQEQGRRGGTESVVTIVAMGRAATESQQALSSGEEQRLASLRDLFESQIKSRISNLAITGEKSQRLPNTSSVRFAGLLASELLASLDSKQICASAGSACKAKTFEPSHVLKALGLALTDSLGAIRFSLGKETTKEQILQLVEVLQAVVSELRTTTKASLESRLKKS